VKKWVLRGAGVEDMSHGIDGEAHRPDILFAITSCRGA